MKKYFCIFGGGGIRGAAYVGAIKALDELDIKITGFAGSSIGAVVAGLLSFGYNKDEIKDIFENINFDFFKDLNFSFGKDFALSKGENFYKWLKTAIEDKFYQGKENEGAVKFKDCKNELVIFSVDLTESKFHEFSKAKTPDVEVAHAIRISVGMPGLYAPVIEGGRCLVDGDLSKGAPLFQTSSTIKSIEDKILEFRLEDNERKRKVSNTVEYLNAVYDTISGFASDFLIKTFRVYEKYDLIKLNLDEISVVDFMNSKEKKEEMIKKGYEATFEYFSKQYKEKEKALFEIKRDIFHTLKKFEFCIKNNSYDEARYEISDIFANLINSKYKINEKIVADLSELRALFNSSLIEKQGFFGTKKILVEAETIYSLINKIYGELNLNF